MLYRCPSFDHEIADKVLTSEEIIGCQDNVLNLVLGFFIASNWWIKSRILLFSVIVFLEVVSDARQVPELCSRCKLSFKRRDSWESFVSFIICFVKTASYFYVVRVRVFWVINLVIIHVFTPGEVWGMRKLIEMKFLMYDLLHNCDIWVVEVVSHWYHGCWRQSPTEAARAYLGVELVEELLWDFWRREDFWVPTQDLFKHEPFFVKFSPILTRVPDQVLVLSRLHKL